MDELGGLRMEDMLIAVTSYSYRLRIAVCLLEEHNQTILRSQATDYCEKLTRDMLEAAEDATSAIRNEISKAEAQARLGSD